MWAYEHPPRGTCVPGCALFGACHCGCGAVTGVQRQSQTDRGYIKGRPAVFHPSHQFNLPGYRKGHIWSRHGVEVRKVRPALRVLFNRYGCWAAVVEVLGVPHGTVNTVMFNPTRQRCSPQFARRVAEVLALHLRPRDPWRFTEEEDRRVPLPAEQEYMRRYHQARERKQFRDRRRERVRGAA